MAARKIRVDLDQRTEKMSRRTLRCRQGHLWGDIIPAEPATRREMAKLGKVEIVDICERPDPDNPHDPSKRCGAERTRVICLMTGMTLKSRIDNYPEDYPVEAGTGKMLVRDARMAELVAIIPELAPA